MSQRERLVVVGNGMAGIRLLEELWTLAPELYEASVFSAEPHGSYNRILLSPVLAGEKRFDEIVTHSDAWYTERGIHLHKGSTVTKIRRKAREIETDDGHICGYDRLVLATGSRPFILPVPGHDLSGVVSFRDIADVEAMLKYRGPNCSAVVIGGGLLGLEAAYGLMRQGFRVRVVHLSDALMERQLDPAASVLMQRSLEQKGLEFLMGAQTEALLGEERVRAVRFKDGREIEADLVVMAAGIRPDVSLARSAGLYCERGVVVNDTLQTFDPRIYAVGECVQHRRETYGLVAPLFEQAKVCANHLAALGYGMYRGSVTATRLKVTGVDLFSMGRFLAGPGDEEIVFQDASQGVYKKLVLCNNRIAGGVLFGDAADSSWYFDLMRQHTDVATLRPHLLFGPQATAGTEGGAGDVMALADEAEICGCNGVSKGTILRAIRGQNLKTLDEVRLCTKASSSCGSCSGLVERLLAGTVVEYKAPGEQALCRCTSHSSDAVREAIHKTAYQTVREVMRALEWRTAEGCSSCRPAINYYLLSTYPETYQDDSQSRLVNERLHANIQQDGSFSVVPRMWGGMTSARELRAIADVVDKFSVPAVKVTGGQRIDLLGIRREQLPEVWADLNAAGMVSGHAYGKAMRTVKTCVGKDWCRYGTQDSTTLGIRLEQMTWGCWTPHKFKMAVSACPRNCAEVTIKDFGVIGVESGWDIHVGGNAGVKLRGTDVLCHVVQDEEVLEYCAAYLQLYREQARYLERTAPWVERFGLASIRARLVEDPAGRAELARRFHVSQLHTQMDPWAERAQGSAEFTTVQATQEVSRAS